VIWVIRGAQAEALKRSAVLRIADNTCNDFVPTLLFQHRSVTFLSHMFANIPTVAGT
jgi:hypothetical protein